MLKRKPATINNALAAVDDVYIRPTAEDRARALDLLPVDE
jgi:hypothetical protein